MSVTSSNEGGQRADSDPGGRVVDFVEPEAPPRSEGEDEPASDQSPNGLVENEGPVVNLVRKRFAGVLGDVADGMDGLTDQADVDHERIAGDVVPRTGELGLVKPVGIDEQMQVRVPLGTVRVVGELAERGPAAYAISPPPGLTKAAKAGVQVIERVTQRTVGGPDGERDEAVATLADVPMHVGSNAPCPLIRTGTTEAVMALRSGNPQAVGIVGIAKYPGVSTALAEATDTSVAEPVSEQRGVDEAAVASPAGVAEGHSVVRLDSVAVHRGSPPLCSVDAADAGGTKAARSTVVSTASSEVETRSRHGRSVVEAGGMVGVRFGRCNNGRLGPGLPGPNETGRAPRTRGGPVGALPRGFARTPIRDPVRTRIDLRLVTRRWEPVKTWGGF